MDLWIDLLVQVLVCMYMYVCARVGAGVSGGGGG